MSEPQTHPDLLAVGRRLGNLMLTKRLNQTETLQATQGFIGLFDTWVAFWTDLNSLRGHPLPDPGCRPTGPEVFAFLDDPAAPRDFSLALGYLHRVREYVERLEAKYGLGEGTA